VIIGLLGLCIVFSISDYHIKSKDEYIVVSTYDSKGLTTLWKYDSSTEKYSEIISNSEVMSSGCISKDGDYVVFSDAIGDNPWDAFLFNMKNKKTYQITKDAIGQFQLKISKNNNTVFGVALGSENPAPKAFRINVKDKTSEFFDTYDEGRAVQCFDISENKMILITYSYKENSKRLQLKTQAGPEFLPPMDYDVYQMDLNNQTMEHITKINAKYIESCSFNSKNNSIVIGGVGIQSRDEKGFYKLNINNKKINTLMTSQDLTTLDLQKPYRAFLNIDETQLYFVGLSKENKIQNFGSIDAYPSALFTYDLKTKQTKKQFEIKDTFITDISLTYK
jgi:hypothetical protein